MVVYNGARSYHNHGGEKCRIIGAPQQAFCIRSCSFLFNFQFDFRLSFFRKG